MKKNVNTYITRAGSPKLAEPFRLNQINREENSLLVDRKANNKFG